MCGALRNWKRMARSLCEVEGWSLSGVEGPLTSGLRLRSATGVEEFIRMARSLSGVERWSLSGVEGPLTSGLRLRSATGMSLSYREVAQPTGIHSATGNKQLVRWTTLLHFHIHPTYQTLRCGILVVAFGDYVPDNATAIFFIQWRFLHAKL